MIRTALEFIGIAALLWLGATIAVVVWFMTADLDPYDYYDYPDHDEH